MKQLLMDAKLTTMRRITVTLPDDLEQVLEQYLASHPAPSH
ncbi:MAG: hypothetical protein AAF708_19040 [Deinococcota bacterium]